MKENKDISEFDNVFRQQLENAVSTPPPGVWEGISSAITATATTATSSAIIVKSALWVKISIGVIATAAIATAVYFSSENTVNETRSLPAHNNAVQENQTSLQPTDVTLGTETEKPADLQERKSPVAEQTIAKQAVPFKPENNKLKPESQKKNELTEYKYQQPEPSNLVKERSNELPALTENVNEKQVTATDDKPETPALKIDSTGIVIPNAVTPNGDGSNDTYLIDIKGEERVRIIIYDINEKMIFETTNKYSGWSCTKNGGEEYPDGTYIVKVIYKFPGLPEQTQTKTLRVIR